MLQTTKDIKGSRYQKFNCHPLHTHRAMMLSFQSSVDKPPVDFKKRGAYLKSKHITHHVCHRTWNTERNPNKLKIAL